MAVLQSLQWSVATMWRRTSLSGVENGLSGREERGGIDFITHCLAIATTVDGKSVLGKRHAECGIL